MNRKFSLIICVVGIIFTLAASESPENRCIEDGQRICLNCKMQGRCVEDPSAPYSFKVEYETACSDDGYFCDNTLGTLSLCARYNPAVTDCSCHGDSPCIQDPYDENVFIKCEGPDYRTTSGEFYCDPADVILSTCECSGDKKKSKIILSKTATEIPCSEDCPFATIDNCPYFVECIGGENVLGQCPNGYCFNAEKCQCISNEATTPLTCPDTDCPFVKDPSDNCTKYYYCSDGVNIPYDCPSPRCFDQDSCACVENTQRIMTIQEPLLIPPVCGSMENPDGGCE